MRRGATRMKRRIKKNPKIGKGMPSAVLLSIVIHAALFLLAGMLVVFTVVKREEKRFEPPKAVERPKMKLKKPKVKIKKTSKPKPTTRIVTKMDRASMPDIQLPEMSGMGEGLGDGIGGFDMMPDLEDVSVFGSGQSIGNDFEGTFYDFKRDRQGRTIIMDSSKFHQALKDFVRSGWETSELARYYRSPKKLYATSFMIPPIRAALAPAAFNEMDTLGYFWMTHYKGQLVHKEGLTFRFRGHGDAFMVVRVGGEVVLNASWPGVDIIITPHWDSSSADSRKYWMGNNLAVVGDWITLEPDETLDMEVMFGDRYGGDFCAMLAVEVEGVEYETGPQGNPILPIFKTATPSLNLVETIHSDLVPGEVCVTNGPVFRDYDTLDRTISDDADRIYHPAPVLEEGNPDHAEMRTWTALNGQVLDAGFVTVIGDKAVLKNEQGKMQKIPLAQFSEKDREFIELAEPPDFSITFSKQSSQRMVKKSPFNKKNVPTVFDYVFGAKLKQTSTDPYNHGLHVEFFAIGAEIDGNNHILLDYQKSSFTPTKENQRSFELRGETVELTDYLIGSNRVGWQHRGRKYSSYLVVVTDLRGKIIAHETPKKWLFENLENLRQVPVGKCIDKTCTRVGPSRPKRFY